jgi:hypothetical protein
VPGDTQMKPLNRVITDPDLLDAYKQLTGTKLDELCFYMYLDKNYFMDKLDDLHYCQIKHAFLAGQRSIKRRHKSKKRKLK